jgi:sugar lactone lactonase YvrE
MNDRVKARLLQDARAAIGESPLWDRGAVIWTDPVARHLLRMDDDGFRAIPVDAAIWSLASMPDGCVAGSLDDCFAHIREDGTITPGPAAEVSAGCRFNDMTAGADGVLWVGAMHRGVLATRGAIYRAQGLGERPVRVAEGLGVPNGMKLSPDGATLFVVDTLSRTLLAYPVLGMGLGEPAIVTDFLDLPGKPDGMAMDSSGHFWVAMWGGGCIAEIASDGATLRSVAVPARHVSSLCFAGEDRLLVSTSRMRLSAHALADQPQSGGLFEIVLEGSA